MRMGLLTTLLVLAGGGLAAQARASGAPPIGGWRVVPELPGMGRAVDTAAVAARRLALWRSLDHGVVLIPAGHERDVERDYIQDNDFRQNNTFFYFTELETQDAWIVMTARGPDSVETALFLPPRNPARERWTGLRLGPDSPAVRPSGMAVVGMRPARRGMYKCEMEAVLEAGFRKNGADRGGYPSIVGGGPNSTTLHYAVNRRQTRDGDLVVMDAGAEWGQYTADVTRTFPVNGKFTPRQKAIYDLVLATQRTAFDSVRPGVTLRDLDRIARTYMRDHSGTLCGDRTCDTYFIHGLGHHLGMDVHDVNVPGRQRLEPGMVFTIEPGIYLPQESLGVRIEDDVLLTAAGAEWLSDKAPRTTDEIERLMRRR